MTATKTEPVPFWSSLLARVGLAIVPALLRNRFGLYSWNDLVQFRGDGSFLKDRRLPKGSAKKLARLGVRHQGKNPLPAIIKHGAKERNPDRAWGVADEDFEGWLWMWGKHPHGQFAKNYCLAVAAANRNVSEFSMLLDQGADPDWRGEGVGTVMGYLMEQCPSAAAQIQMLGLLHARGDIPWHQVHSSVGAPVWSRADYQALEDSGIRLPDRIVEHALGRLVSGMEYEECKMAQAIEALEWWLLPQRKGNDRALRALLVEQWIDGFNAGLDDDYQPTIEAYWRVLTQDVVLEDAPNNVSWMHAVAKSPFCASFPEEIVNHLLAHPSSDLTRLDNRGKTCAEIIQDNLSNEYRYLASGKERETQAKRYDLLLSKLRAGELENSVEHAGVHKTSPRAAPRL